MLLICDKCVVWLYCPLFLETEVFFLSINVSRNRNTGTHTHTHTYSLEILVCNFMNESLLIFKLGFPLYTVSILLPFWGVIL